MAEQDDTEKTEDPTQKRLDEALERGDVVKSQEVNTWFMIAAATLVLATFSGGMSQNVATIMRGLLANAGQILVDGPALPHLFQKIGIELIAALSVPFLVLILAALAGNMVQHRLVWSFEVLSPKLSKISPLAGLKRLFSMVAVANFLKGLVKLLVVGGVLTALMWPERFRIMALGRSDIADILPFTLKLALKLMGAVVAMLGVVAAADYLFSYRRWYEKQKMSLREMKEEFKQSEGDPTIKGKMKQVRQSPHAQAHDGQRAEGRCRHHQPDALFDRAAIRARHGSADLRRQGRRRGGLEDPRGRRRALHPLGGESAAGPRAARHRRDR